MLRVEPTGQRGVRPPEVAKMGVHRYPVIAAISCWHYPHSMRNRIYETVGCPSVCPPVCPIRPLQQRAAGLLL